MDEKPNVGGFHLDDEVMVQIGDDLPSPGIVTQLHLVSEQVDSRPYLTVRLDIGGYVYLWLRPNGQFLSGAREAKIKRR